MNKYIFETGTKKKIAYAFLAGVFLLLAGILLSSSGSGHQEAATTEETHVVAATSGEQTVKQEAPVPVHHEEEKTVSTGMKVLANFYPLIYFGFFLCLAAIFILSAATVAWGGWQIQIEKITLAITRNMFVFIPLLGVFFILFGHQLFSWMDNSLYDPKGPNFDAVLAMKHDYLKTSGVMNFWWRYVILGGLCMFLAYKWWKNLTSQDENPSMKLFSQSRNIGGVSMVLIAFILDTFCTWDWSMSVQPHWYSTMFPWYTMASAAVTVFSITLLVILHLKDQGLLPNVNENHLHDVAKWMFVVSIFWTYVFFGQYMLIWYGNIPEETSFFINRRQLNNYGFLFHIAFILDFVFPFFILLTRGSKRNRNVAKFMAFVLIIGHWMDFYLMIGPALVPKGGFGLISLGALLIVGSVFAYLLLWNLSKVKDLESTTHPYYKESLQHHI